MLRPIPPAHDAGGLSPWQSTKEGLRYLRTRQALQGVYLIDINAMVFGMPRALFPAMAGSVFDGGHHHARASSTPRPGWARSIGAVTTGWVAHLRRQGWAVIVAVSVWGVAIAAVRLRRHPVGRPRAAGRGRVGRRDLGRAAQHHPADARSPSASAAGCRRFRWRSCRAGRGSATWSRARWPTLTSIEFSVVSGGLACIVGAAVIGAAHAGVPAPRRRGARRDRRRARMIRAMSPPFAEPTWGEVDPAVFARIVVVSPHFDDAAMGAGHLIGQLRRHHRDHGARRPPPAYPDEPSEWDALGGFVAGDDVVAVRREEDVAAMAVLESDYRWLEFADHQYLAPADRPDAGRRGARPRRRSSPRSTRPRSSSRWAWPTPTTS